MDSPSQHSFLSPITIHHHQVNPAWRVTGWNHNLLHSSQAPMSPFPFSLHPPPIPSFPLHQPSCRPLHSFSLRTLHFPLLAYPPRHRHHHVHLHPHSNLLLRSVIPSALASPSSGSEPAQLQFDNVKRGLGRLLVIAAVCGLAVARCQRGIAAENAILSSGRSTLAVWWPKIQQILQLLREQGLILAALLSLSAFFSMAETAITTLWPWKVRELAEKEPENGVFRMLRGDVTRFLTTILIGTTVVNIGATALVTEAATAIFGEAGVSASTGVMTVLVLLLTEITPKSLAVHNATEVARVVVRPVAWLSLILYPVGRVATFLSMGMLKMLGLKGVSEPYVTEDELKLMLRGAELSGAIEEEEQDMIENVLTIKDTHVREVMTPLIDVVAIDGGATLIDFKNLWEIHQYSRVPVFEERIDNIVGIAYAMDMLEHVEQVEKLKDITVKEMAHKPTYFVPDSMSVWDLLREFRIRQVHMAVVLNEYGGTVGIVTLEDVVEEIVGEIFDENDSKEEIQKKTGYIVMREDGTFDVDANTSIDQLSDDLHVKIPEGHQYETVSGFVCETFGYIPEEGGKTVVILEKKANNEEENGYQEKADNNHNPDDNHNNHEKHQAFEIEIIEANERKVGKVLFKPISSNSAVAKDNKGMKRLLKAKVIKRKKQTQGDDGDEITSSLEYESDDDALSTSPKQLPVVTPERPASVKNDETNQ